MFSFPLLFRPSAVFKAVLQMFTMLRDLQLNEKCGECEEKKSVQYGENLLSRGRWIRVRSLKGENFWTANIHFKCRMKRERGGLKNNYKYL